MTDLQKALEKLADGLRGLPDDLLLEELLIMGAELPPFPDEERLPENLVKGCLSEVFITSHLQDGKVFFHGDADSLVVKGYVYILLEALSGRTPEEIRASRETIAAFIKDTRLDLSLTPSRSNAFNSIYQAMCRQAEHVRT